jgi:predicted alpha/beta hydrolase
MATTDAAQPDQAEGASLEIPALDGQPLAASVFAPPDRPPAAATAIVVIAPGAAIPRRFYRHFARAVAERGAIAVSFDVRDIGGSRRGAIAQATTRMRDWALKDVAGVIAWTRRTYPRLPLLWVGHSMGGFATGLADNGHEIERQLSVATLNGYWGRMAGLERYRVLTMMGGFAPLVIATRGYMPGALMGGEDMPGPAFLEWRQWCLHPDFLFGDDTLPEKAHFERFRAPNRFIQIADDAWGTAASVGDMARRFTASAHPHVVQVTPSMANVARIGHFGFFKPEMKAALWTPALDWLLEGARS